MNPIVIAVDGTAASGKGTLGAKLATHFGFDHLDSGKLYRLVAHDVLRAGGNPSDRARAIAAAKAVDPLALDTAALMQNEVSRAASVVAVFPEVRAALLGYQRQFASNPPHGKGAVIDGRDIGTVVCPEATAKLFIDARAEVRARRRLLELKNRRPAGDQPLPSEESILAEINARDERDRSRKVAPMRPAPDADLLDTSDLDIDAAFAAALALVEAKVKKALAARPRG